VTYEQFFERNYGVLSAKQQERIRRGKVVIIGCGGIGGVIAVVLARSGVERFLLMESDRYELSNMNRQIACFSDTLGENKAVCVADQIRGVNPDAELEIVQRALTIQDVDQVAGWGDVIAPVMDEWPLSLTTLEVVRQTRPAIMAYPVGALGRVSVFTSQSPSVAECLAMPYGYGYEKLKEYTERPEARQLLQYYVTEGEWSEEWFDRWVEAELPHAQLATVVWLTACFAAQEMLKLLSGRWNPMVAPHYWHITPGHTGMKKFGLGRRLISRLSRRESSQRLFPHLTGSKALLRLFTRLLA
jgi:hypothetical protein